MRNTLTKTIAAVLSLAAVLQGCRPEVVSSSTFAPEFRLVTETFHGGEDFVFRIYSNHKSVIVTGYECEFASEAVILNREYSVTDGFCEFREKEVRVDETHRGRLSITVKDPDTGAEKSFSGVYTAYIAFDNYLRIENDVVSTQKVNLGLPAVVDGDDFRFTVHSNLKSLVLKDFWCEFNDGQLVRGKEYLFSERGELSITMKSVSVGADRFTEPSTLSLTFLDGISGEEIVLEADYVVLEAFRASLTVNPKTVTDGEDFKFRIASNRKSVTASSFMTTPSTDADELRPADLYAGQAVTMNAEGYAEFITRNVSVETTHTGTLKVILVDREYTGREAVVSADYRLNVKPGASDVAVDKPSFSMNLDDSEVVTVSTGSPNSDGLFSVKLVSGDGGVLIDGKQFTSTVDLEGRSSFTLKANKSGAVRLSVFSTTNPSASTAVDVFVRHRVAALVKCVLDPNKYDIIYQHKREDFDGRELVIGSFTSRDLPSNITVGLYKWDGSKNVANTYDLTEFINKSTPYTSPYECTVQFEVRANPENVSMPLAENFKAGVEWSKGSPYAFSAVSLRGGGDKNMQDAVRTFRDYDDIWWGRRAGTHLYYCNTSPVWKVFDLRPRWAGFSWDTDHLELRYVVMAYKDGLQGNEDFSRTVLTENEQTGKVWWCGRIIPNAYVYTVADEITL